MYRPQASAFLEDAFPTLASKAAALAQGLILAHAFMDANKRTGILSGCVFMMFNGCNVVAERKTLYPIAINVENKTLDHAGLTAWFEDPTNISELSGDEWDLVQLGEMEERLGQVD